MTFKEEGIERYDSHIFLWFPTWDSTSLIDKLCCLGSKPIVSRSEEILIDLDEHGELSHLFDFK